MEKKLESVDSIDKIMEESKDFLVECNVCHQILENWIGSTPCCGSIAYLVEDGDKIYYIKSIKEWISKFLEN